MFILIRALKIIPKMKILTETAIETESFFTRHKVYLLQFSGSMKLTKHSCLSSGAICMTSRSAHGPCDMDNPLVHGNRYWNDRTPSTYSLRPVNSVVRKRRSNTMGCHLNVRIDMISC